MKPLILTLALAVLASCNHAPPRAVPVPAPKQSETITPSVDKVRVEVVHARDTSILVNAGLENAVKEVERLASQKSASEKELKSLSSLLQAEQARTAGLYKNLTEASQRVDELSKRGSEKDLENYELRTSLEIANTRLADAERWQQENLRKVNGYDEAVKKAKTLEAWKEENMPKIGVYDLVKFWIKWVSIFIGGLIAIYLFLRFGLPLLRRFIFPV